MVPFDVGTLLTNLWRFGVVAVGLVSLLVIRRLSGSELRWADALRARFLYGVPWGSAVSLGMVLLFYLLVQGGLWDWHRPVMVAFTATSYRYPLGALTAGLAHASPGHLTSNLTSALVFAPLAEYVWGHYPSDARSVRDRWLDRPAVRAFVVFPAGVLAVAVATGLFAWGPVIGFSGVVFALAGFALVRFPIVTVVALVFRSALRTALSAVTDPIVVTRASEEFARPSWAGIAVQGHAFGLLLGIVLGAYVLWRRGGRPDPVRLWIGTLLAGMSLSLWAFWWVRGSETYVLYRGVGVIVVLLLALVVAIALSTEGNRVLGTRVTSRQAAAVALVIPLVTMSMVAVPLNLTEVSSSQPDRAMEIEDYAVYYDRGVEDRMVSVIDVSLLNETTSVRTNGVIVTSRERHLWRRMVSSSALAFEGSDTVVVGGVGWREVIHVERRGWTPVGGEPVYQVWFEHDDDRILAYESPPAPLEPVIEGHHLYLGSENGTFWLEVYGPSVAERVSVPSPGTNTSVGDLTIVHDAGTESINVSTSSGTRIRIADREQYGGSP